MTSLREKYMSDPDIIPPSGTTKQEWVDRMVSQMERQNRNNSRAYSLLNPSASDTAEGGGSDMYVQIHRIKKASQMLRTSTEEDDYMQAIKLAMERHADEYSFMKAEEDYSIVKRYEIKSKSKERPFLVVDHPDLDAPITLSRDAGVSSKNRSWYPVYGHGAIWAGGTAGYGNISVAHVQKLEQHILDNPALKEKWESKGLPLTGNFMNSNFTEINNKDVFPRSSKGGFTQGSKTSPNVGLFGLSKRAREAGEGKEYDEYNNWIEHVKSLAEILPVGDKPKSQKAAEYESLQDTGLGIDLNKFVYSVHHGAMGGKGSEAIRTVNMIQGLIMNQIDPNASPKKQAIRAQTDSYAPLKQESPGELINGTLPEDSHLRALLLPLMSVIHAINNDSDIDDSPVWQLGADGAQMDPSTGTPIERHEESMTSIEAIDSVNQIHVDHIVNNLDEDRASRAFINSPEVQAFLRFPTNSANRFPGVNAALRFTGSYQEGMGETFHDFLNMAALGGEKPTSATPATESSEQDQAFLDAENNAQYSTEVPADIGAYLDASDSPVSREDFDALSPMRQAIMLESIQNASESSATPEAFNDTVKKISDDLNSMSPSALLDDDTYGDALYTINSNRGITPVTDDEEAVEAPAEEEVEDTTAAVEPEAPATEEDEEAVGTTEGVEPEDTAPPEQVEDVDEDARKDQDVLEQLNIDSDGALNDFSEEDQKAILDYSKSPGTADNRDKLIAAIQTGDSGQLNQFISTIADPEIEQPEEEDSERGLNNIEQAALDHLKSITEGDAVDKLSPELQRDVAQAAVAIQRTTTQQLAEARKKAEEDNTDLTANQIEGLERGGDSSLATLANSIDTGNETRINQDVQKFRGTEESYEGTTERTTDEGAVGDVDEGATGGPDVSPVAGDAEESGVDAGDDTEDTDEKVDGKPAGGDIPDAVDPVREKYNVTPPISYDGRLITTITLPDGTVQPFYRRTGKGTRGEVGGAEKGEWVPYDGHAKVGPGGMGWFDKHAYTLDEDGKPLGEMLRYGTQQLKDISEELSESFEAGNLFENQENIISDHFDDQGKADGLEIQDKDVQKISGTGAYGERTDEEAAGHEENMRGINEHLAGHGADQAAYKLENWDKPGGGYAVGSRPLDEASTEEPAPVTPDAEAEQEATEEETEGVTPPPPPRDNGVQGKFEGFNGDDKDDTPPPPPPAADEEPEEDPTRKFRQQHLDDIGDEVLETLIKPRHMGYHDIDALKETLLDSGKTKDDKFDEFLGTAETAHVENKNVAERTDPKVLRSFRARVRRDPELHQAMKDHVADHVKKYDGRAVPDTDYRTFGEYIRHISQLPAKERKDILDKHHAEAATSIENKEKASKEEETESSKAAWAAESQRVQKQITALASITGPDGKVSDKWDNNQAIHYLRNLNKIVWHDTNKNLGEAGVNTDDIKDLSGLLDKLGAGDRLPKDVYARITTSISAINKTLTPRQKRDLSEEMLRPDYMDEDHRKQIATENETSRKNEEDYQERLGGVASKGLGHSIFSSPSGGQAFQASGDGAVPSGVNGLFSDPEDMKKKDEEEALRREEDNLGPENPAEMARRRKSQGHPPTESPGEGYAYHPETGQWMDTNRFQAMAEHLSTQLGKGESVSFAPSKTIHTEHVGRDRQLVGKRAIIHQSHEPLSVQAEGASDYISVTKNRDGHLIWSPVTPPSQNKHGHVSPDDVHHDTGDSDLDERLNNAHAIGKLMGTHATLDHEEGSESDHARHGMENNIIRSHDLAGQAAPKNHMNLNRGPLSPANLADVSGKSLAFARKHGGSLARKLKLKEIGKAALPLLYDPTKQPKLYAKWTAAAAKKVIGEAPVATDEYGAPKAGRLRETDPVTGEETPKSWRGSETSRSRVPGVEGVKSAVRGTKGRLAAVIPSEVSDVAGDVKGAAKKAGEKAREKVTDVVRGGLYEGNEKINQATADAAKKAGKIIDRTKAGASGVGQAAAAAGLAGVDESGSPVAPTEGTRRGLGQQPSTPAKAPEGETEAEATKRLRPPAGTIHPETGEEMTSKQRKAAGRTAAKEARRQAPKEELRPAPPTPSPTTAELGLPDIEDWKKVPLGRGTIPTTPETRPERRRREAEEAKSARMKATNEKLAAISEGQNQRQQASQNVGTAMDSRHASDPESGGQGHGTKVRSYFARVLGRRSAGQDTSPAPIVTPTITPTDTSKPGVTPLGGGQSQPTQGKVGGTPQATKQRPRGGYEGLT